MSVVVVRQRPLEEIKEKIEEVLEDLRRLAKRDDATSKLLMALFSVVMAFFAYQILMFLLPIIIVIGLAYLIYNYLRDET